MSLQFRHRIIFAVLFFLTSILGVYNACTGGFSARSFPETASSETGDPLEVPPVTSEDPSQGRFIPIASLKPGQTHCARAGDTIVLSSQSPHRGSLHVTNCSKTPGKITITSDSAASAALIGSVNGQALNVQWERAGKVIWKNKEVTQISNAPVYKFGPFTNPVKSFFYKDLHQILARHPNVNQAPGVAWYNNYFPIKEIFEFSPSGCQAGTCIAFDINNDPTTALKNFSSYEEVYAIVRDSNWSLQRQKVVWYDAASGKSAIALEKSLKAPVNGDQTPGVGFGVILVNSLAWLDSPGEWFYNSEDKKIYFWPPDGLPPQLESSEFIMASGSALLDIHLAGDFLLDVELSNLSFSNSFDTSLRVTQAGNVTLQSIKASNGVSDGVDIFDVKALNVTGLEVNTHGRNGLHAYKAQSVSVMKSSFRENGRAWEQPELGMQMSAINIANVDGAVTIADNTVTFSGYSGFQGAELQGAVRIETNQFKENCLVLNDCGEIYINNESMNSNSTPKFIRGNTITGGFGNTEGTPYTKNYANGIYLDFAGSNYNITGNQITSTGVTGGIQLNASKNISLANNKVEARNGAALWYTTYSGTCATAMPETNNFTDNYFASSSTDLGVIVLMNAEKDCYEKMRASFKTGNQFIPTGASKNIFIEI